MQIQRYVRIAAALVVALSIAACSDGSENPRTIPTGGPDYISPSEVGPNTGEETHSGDVGEGEGADDHENAETLEGTTEPEAAPTAATN